MRDFNDGPVRRVLRANMHFESIRNEGLVWVGRKHDGLMASSLTLLMSTVAAVLITPWTLILGGFVLALQLFGWRHAHRRHAELVVEAEEALEEYRVILEGALAREDLLPAEQEERNTLHH